MKIKTCLKKIMSKYPLFKSYEEMPTWLIVVIAISAFMLAGFGAVIAFQWVDYVKALNASSGVSIFAIILGIYIFVFCWLTYYFGLMGGRMSKILSERWFK